MRERKRRRLSCLHKKSPWRQREEQIREASRKCVEWARQGMMPPWTSGGERSRAQRHEEVKLPSHVLRSGWVSRVSGMMTGRAHP